MIGRDYMERRYTWTKPLSNWEAAEMPKPPKRQTYTPKLNRKTKRY